MAPKEKKEMTVDELAVIVNGSFTKFQKYMDQRFEQTQGQMDQRFEQTQGQMDARFNRVDQRLDRLESEARDIRLVQAKHTEILTYHSRKLNEIQGDLNMVIDDDMDHAKRLKRLERDNKIIKAKIGLV